MSSREAQGSADAGEAILDIARAGGQTSLFVVGTGKNVGKTVAMRAVAAAAGRRGLITGITSSGRDGEAVDAADALAKPRLFLTPGTILATARNLVPPHPAAETIDLTDWRTAAGEVVILRVRRAGYFELAGPASAAGIRACVERFARIGCDQSIVDGALDRVAALAGGDDAVIVSVGAAAARTMEEAVADAQALCARLRIPPYDPALPFVRIEGALTPSIASQFVAARDTRQIVVADPTRVAAQRQSAARDAAGPRSALRTADQRRCRDGCIDRARPLFRTAHICAGSLSRDRFADVRRLRRVDGRCMKFGEIVDATSASALQTAWLHAALEPASDFGRRVYLQIVPFRPGQEEQARRHAESIAQLAHTMDAQRIDAMRDALRSSPDPVPAISRAAMNDVLEDAQLLELLRFFDAAHRVDASLISDRAAGSCAGTRTGSSRQIRLLSLGSVRRAAADRT